MICLSEISLSIDLSSLIIASALLAIVLVIFLIKIFSRGKMEIDGIDFGLEGICFHICKERAVRQIAYKIWVEINTRVIGVKIDLEKDIIRSIHESYYSFFTSTRLLIEDIPAKNVKDTKELILLAICFLNDVMRPYLTKWGLKFNKWYDEEKEKSNTLSPQEIQKRFKEYDEMTADLLKLNHNVVSYSDALKKIAFEEKRRSKL